MNADLELPLELSRNLWHQKTYNIPAKEFCDEDTVFDYNSLHTYANLIIFYKRMTLQICVSNQFLLNFWEFMRM